VNDDKPYKEYIHCAEWFKPGEAEQAIMLLAAHLNISFVRVHRGHGECPEIEIEEN
jgi:hypothetical protein